MGVYHYEIALLPRAYFGQQLPSTLSEADRERGEDIASGWWGVLPSIRGIPRGYSQVVADRQVVGRDGGVCLRRRLEFRPSHLEGRRPSLGHHLSVFGCF